MHQQKKSRRKRLFKRKRLIIGTFAALSLLILGWLQPSDLTPTSHSNPKIGPRLIAHRGMSSWAPENTLASFQMAIDEGCDMVELDVHLTRDDHLVVIHDDCVGRTTNFGAPKPVREFSLAELKALDAGSWFHPCFSGEKIPSLVEVITLPRKGTGLMIELKAQDVPPAYLVECVAETMRATFPDEIPNNVFLGSLNPYIIRELLAQIPEFPIVGISDNSDSMATYLSLGLKHIALKDSMANSHTIEALKRRGVEIWAWTVDRQETAQTLTQYGIGGLISNDPINLGIRPR